MTHRTRKLILPVVIGLVIVGALAVRLTRSVPPFQPPPGRQLGAWGSLDGESAQQLQGILDRQVNRLKVPGLQAFVRTSAGKTWSGTSGTKDLARKAPLGREDILRVGSVTKTFTAVLILQLVEEGRLSLDDRLATWFPSFPNAGLITVRQLLNHSSGIPEFLDTPDVLMKSILWWTYWKPEEVLDVAAKRTPYFAPGRGWHYSNSNYVLLGLIAERVTSKPVAELLRTKIIDPLKLANTYFVPYEPGPAALVHGFDRDLSHFPGMLDIDRSDTSWATAAFTSGALASTADNLGTFYNELFAGALLSSPLMKEMTTFISASNPGFEAQNGSGLGLMRLEVDGRELVGHVGEFMGSTTIAMYAPGKGHIIVVSSNLSYPNLVDVLADIQRAIDK